MEQFFEAWVETVMRAVSQRSGGLLKSGRRRETISALSWEPPYVGSQRSLIPDLILEMEDVAIIVDAKYKKHWEELQERGWRGQDDDLREQHRADLLQVLAYANLVSTKHVVCCLVYPCSSATWESLARRDRLFHCSELPNRGRSIQVWLSAIPMSAAAHGIATPFSEKLRSARSMS